MPPIGETRRELHVPHYLPIRRNTHRASRRVLSPPRAGFAGPRPPLAQRVSPFDGWARGLRYFLNSRHLGSWHKQTHGDSMNWSRWYAVRSYVKSSLSIVPFLALVLEQLTLRGSLAIDARLSWIPRWPLGMSGTMAAMQTIISLILAFIVFTFGSMLIAVQIAGGQLTPRIIATTLLRDNVIRFTVGLFIFTLLFAIGTISRIETSQPQFTIWLCVGLGVVSLTAFLYLIDYSARLLRPGSVVWRVADQGFRVIDEVYPHKLGESAEPTVLQRHLGTPDRIIEHSGTSAVVLAADVKP